MSQHRYRTQYQSRTVDVLMGWDATLQTLFLAIYSADDDVEESLFDTYATEGVTLEALRQALTLLGVAVPESMFVETAHDQRHDIGNRIQEHGGPP